MNDIRYDGEIPLGEIHIIEETNWNFKLSSKVLEPEEILSVLLASINKVYSDFLGYENNGLILSKEGQLVFDLLEKINKYKSIEEQLGCPLEVREQALKNGIYIENIYGEMVNFKVMLVYKNKELGYYFRFINDGYVLLTDYKKTWWLKENLEE